MTNICLELGEDKDNYEDYMICNCLHTVVACIFFQLVDVTCVLVTSAVYVYYAFYLKLSTESTIPMAVLFTSFLAFPSGPVGLFTDSERIFLVYYVRLYLIIIFSAAWLLFSTLVQGDVYGYLIGFIWFLAVLLYTWGAYVTSYAYQFVANRYKGYDDVDPEMRAAFNKMLAENMQELEDIEKEEEAEKKEKTARRDEKLRRRRELNRRMLEENPVRSS